MQRELQKAPQLILNSLKEMPASFITLYIYIQYLFFISFVCNYVIWIHFTLLELIITGQKCPVSKLINILQLFSQNRNWKFWMFYGGTDTEILANTND